MHDQLKALMLILAVGSAVAIGARRIGLPYNVPLVLVGLGLVFTKLHAAVPLDPDIVLVAVLPVLVFEGALFANLDHLRHAAKPILLLAVPGVFVSLGATALVAAFALDLSLPIALLLGALLAITDTVSVLMAFRSVRVPQRLAAIMEGESLFNDGTALVLVAVTTGIVMKGSSEPVDAARALAVATLGGGALGAAFGAIGAAVLRRTPDHLTAILASLVLVFATALLAEEVHASPVIAVVVMGLSIGRAARRSLEPSRVLALEGFWETAGFALNVVIFLLVGMQIRPQILISQAPAIGIALVSLHVGRALAVYLGFGGLRLLFKEPVPLAWQHVMVAGNIKGSLSMAAVLALPASVPFRDGLIAIVFGVTLVTLVTQALPFKTLLRVLRVSTKADSGAQQDEARATLVVARRGQTELDELFAAGLLSRTDHAARRAALQVQVVDAELVLRGREDGDEHDAYVSRCVLNAQKVAVLEAARKGVVSAEVAEAHLHRMDETLLRIRAREEGGA
jgi:monovalent cation:H+ antiporter, CPA1 family